MPKLQANKPKKTGYCNTKYPPLNAVFNGDFRALSDQVITFTSIQCYTIFPNQWLSPSLTTLGPTAVPEVPEAPEALSLRDNPRLP